MDKDTAIKLLTDAGYTVIYEEDQFQRWVFFVEKDDLVLRRDIYVTDTPADIVSRGVLYDRLNIGTTPRYAAIDKHPSDTR